MFYYSVKVKRIMNSIFSDDFVFSKRSQTLSFKDNDIFFRVGSIIPHNKKFYKVISIDRLEI